MAKARATAPSEVVADQLGYIRQRKGWTQEQLAEAVSAIGVKMDRTVVAKIETRKRNVTIDDLFALAAALEVSPVALLLPFDADAEIALAPGLVKDAEAVRRWACFEGPIGTGGATELRFYFENVGDEHSAAVRYPVLSMLQGALPGMRMAALNGDEARLVAAIRAVLIPQLELQADAIEAGLGGGIDGAR